MAFDANVIVRQYAERPWHHFRIKPNDDAYDSASGIQDIIDSGQNVTLPRGVIHIGSTINWVDGGRLRGSGVVPKILPTLPMLVNTGTVLRSQIPTAANSCLINMSDKAAINNDVTAGNITAYICDLTIDCNGNSVAANGSRNADGNDSCEIGIYMNRCGNSPGVIAERFAVYGALKSGIVGDALFTTGLRDFLIGECPDRSIDLANYFGFTAVAGAELAHHDFVMERFGISYCGNWLTIDFSTVFPGGSSGAFDYTTSAYKNGGAILNLGRGCRVDDFSYQRNAGAMVWSGFSPASNRGSEGSTMSRGYFERNAAKTTGAASNDNACALLILYQDGDVMRHLKDCFFGGNGDGSAAGKTAYQILRIQPVTSNNKSIVTAMPMTSNKVAGPEDPGDWLLIERIGAEGTNGGGTVGATIESLTSRFRAPADSNHGFHGPKFNVLKPFLDRTLQNFRFLRDNDSNTTPITVTASAITIDRPGWYKLDIAASGNLDAVNLATGISDDIARGWVIALQEVNSARDITCRHSIGDKGFLNSSLADVNLAHAGSIIFYMYDDTIAGGRWCQIGGGRLV